MAEPEKYYIMQRNSTLSGIREFNQRKAELRCRNCGNDGLEAQQHNGIDGPGFAQWDFKCGKCGAIN